MFRKVENKGRYKTAQPYYWHVHDDGTDYLFTESQLKEAEVRAGKNPEDIPSAEPEHHDAWTTGLVTGLISGGLLSFSTYWFLQNVIFVN